MLRRRAKRVELAGLLAAVRERALHVRDRDVGAAQERPHGRVGVQRAVRVHHVDQVAGQHQVADGVQRNAARCARRRARRGRHRRGGRRDLARPHCLAGHDGGIARHAGCEAGSGEDQQEHKKTLRHRARNHSYPARPSHPVFAAPPLHAASPRSGRLSCRLNPSAEGPRRCAKLDSKRPNLNRRAPGSRRRRGSVAHFGRQARFSFIQRRPTGGKDRRVQQGEQHP